MNYRQHNNILVEKHKVIFFVIPKNACSSMKSQIVEVLGLEKGPNYPKDIHDPEVYPYPFAKTENLNNQYQDYFKFCIARNPWARLVSCFKDKIRPADFNSDKFKDGVAFPLIKNSPRFYGGMPFEEFVEVVCSIPDAIGEHHFTSQIYQITDAMGNLLVNYIGNLETLDSDLSEISKKTGFPTSHFPHFRKTKKNSYQEYYNDELVEKVRKRYAADISFFKYEFDQKENLVKIGFVNDELRESISNSSWIVSVLKDKIHHENLLDKAKIEVLNEQLKVKDRKLRKMQNSLSWKITTPLRKLVSFLGFLPKK